MDEKHFYKCGYKYSRNSETNASEFWENLEEMFSQYYIHSDLPNQFKPTWIKVSALARFFCEFIWLTGNKP